MSEFVDLCESMGLDAGDPDVIDIMINRYHEEDLDDEDFDKKDDLFKEDLDWYQEQLGFEFK